MKLDDFNSTFNSAKVSKVLEDKFGTKVSLNKLSLNQLQSLKSRVAEAHKKTIKSMPFNSGHRNPEYLEQVALLEAIELKINEIDQMGEDIPTTMKQPTNTDQSSENDKSWVSIHMEGNLQHLNSWNPKLGGLAYKIVDQISKSNIDHDDKKALSIILSHFAAFARDPGKDRHGNVKDAEDWFTLTVDSTRLRGEYDKTPEIKSILGQIRKLVHGIIWAHEKFDESAPEGWEGTVRAMKKHRKIDNPWALAHHMKKKGYKSHVDETKDEEEKEDKKSSSGSGLSGSQNSALLQLVGRDNLMKAKRAIQLAAQGKAIPGNLVSGFKPIVDMLLDILQGGSSYAKRLQTLDKQASRGFAKEGMLGGIAGATLGGMVGGPLGALAGGYLGSNVDDEKKVSEGRYLAEGETEKAQLIMAVKDMVDRVQGMVEDLNKMKVEDLVALTDKMRDEFGQEQATSFTSGANDILSAGIDALTNARTEMDNAVLGLTGEAPAPGAGMAAEPGAEMSPEVTADAGAELPAEPGAELPAPEGGEEVGRELRESRARMRKRVLESSRFLGKLAK